MRLVYEAYFTAWLDCVVWKRVLTVTATDTEVLFCCPEPVLQHCYEEGTLKEALNVSGVSLQSIYLLKKFRFPFANALLFVLWQKVQIVACFSLTAYSRCSHSCNREVVATEVKEMVSLIKMMILKRGKSVSVQ